MSHLCPSIDATTTWASAATAALTAPSAAARSTVGLGLQNRWSTARPFGRRTTTRLTVGTDLLRPDALTAHRSADANARATERQRGSGQPRPAWPGNAVTCRG